MSRKFDAIFDDPDKAYMTFTYRNCGKSVTLNNEYDYDVTWDEVLGDLVMCLEGEFGYSFNIDKDIGIYYPGKTNDD